MDTPDKQTQLLQAVQQNNIDKVVSLLRSSQDDTVSVDINGVTGDLTPLIAAIIAKNVEMTLLLLENGAKSDDVLFYCIDTGSDVMLRTVCEHLKATSKESLLRTLNALCTDVGFKPICSPLMYAARENCHKIVKTLLEFGAEMPDLKAILDHSKDDLYEQYLACYSWHQAISSEAYLLYASYDPIQAAINAGKAVLKSKSLQQNHLQSKYEDLIVELDRFLATFLAMASSENEIGTLLWTTEDKSNEDCAVQVGVLPQRIHDTLELQFKQFISSTPCTHFVLDQWYMKWNNLCTLSFLFWTALVISCQPLLCLTHMYLPFSWHRQVMKTPYVRFLVHWVSRIYFIGFIMYITASASKAGEFTGNEHQQVNQVYDYFTDPPSIVTIIAYLWILGMTWREILELCSSGVWQYWTNLFNYSDILQLILYWSALVCHILSYVKKGEELQGLCDWISLFNFSSYSEGSIESILTKYTFCDKFTGGGMTKRYIENASIMTGVGLPYGNTFEPTLDILQNPDTEDDSQLLFITIDAKSDSKLVGDALFGVATVLSCLALLRDIVIVPFVGPLRASFGGMISDIVRFFILFIFLWISFALGLTQLYTTYDIMVMTDCYDDEEACESTPFKTLSDSLATLFWSLFNPIEEEGLHIDPQYKIAFAVGETLYAIYMVVAVVVMLNALIAMMGNTYTRVEENSEVEWKVARTNLMAGYMTTSAALPPPYNLLPTLRMVRNWSSTLYKKICGRNDYHKPIDKADENANLHQMSYKKLIETLVDRYIDNHAESDSGSTRKCRLNTRLGKLDEDITDVKDSVKKIEKQMELILQFLRDQNNVQSSRSTIKRAKKLLFK